ncbi:hypothetical protein F4805DRAFT_455133 [Annulohypoxylon moriforme]|nr:hypothetical protein F4805DRAFT_455133 [Annulohypoxylon moriforme]
MPSEKVDNASGEAIGKPLSALDSKIINAILKHCLESAKPTPVVWENVRKELDFKTVEVTRERYRQLCKKHHWFEGNKDQASTPTSSPKKRGSIHVDTTPVQENGTASVTSGWEADVNSPTPVKKRKFSKVAREPKQEGEQKTIKGHVTKKRCIQPKREMSDDDEA